MVEYISQKMQGLKKKTFYKMDYDIKSFNKVRKKFRCMKINSFQSKRLGI